MSESKEDPPPSYIRAIRLMNSAARTWMQQHPFAEGLRFNDLEAEYKKKARVDEPIRIVTPLGNVIDEWAANEDTRALLRAMNAAVDDGSATYLQAKAVIEMAYERFIERRSGHFDKSDHRCPQCEMDIAGYTRTDDSSAPPQPGMMTVCPTCVSRLRFEEAGFVLMTTQEFNRLPKQVRIQLARIQKVMRRAAEDKKQRRLREV